MRRFFYSTYLRIKQPQEKEVVNRVMVMERGSGALIPPKETSLIADEPVQLEAEFVASEAMTNSTTTVLDDVYVTADPTAVVEGGIEEVLDHERRDLLQQEHPESDVSDVREDVLRELRDVVLEAMQERLPSGRRKYKPVTQLQNSQDVEGFLRRQLKKRDKKGGAFYLVDLSILPRKMELWDRFLPEIRPYYAIKCNPDKMLVRALTAMGAGADCASSAEIRLAISQGCKPDDIIYANPCKSATDLQFAQSVGVRLMTFDNEEELHKIAKIFGPEAQVVLRILADDSYSDMGFGSKFGATPRESEHLLGLARKLGLDVVGISFHVGSGCRSSDAYAKTFERAAGIRLAGEELGHPMGLIDIGGGWPGLDTPELAFHQIAEPIPRLLQEHLPDCERVIAEPGRYFATETVVLACNIVGKRVRSQKSIDMPIPRRSDTTHASRGSAVASEADDEKVALYISDGVYGSFNNIFFDHAQIVPHVLSSNGDVRPWTNPNPIDESGLLTTIWGQTCDSIDVVVEDHRLPSLSINDWLYFTNMGAYSQAASSRFNGFSGPDSCYYMS